MWRTICQRSTRSVFKQLRLRPKMSSDSKAIGMLLELFARYHSEENQPFPLFTNHIIFQAESKCKLLVLTLLIKLKGVTLFIFLLDVFCRDYTMSCVGVVAQLK